MAASGVVGLVYDVRMCAHENESDRKHPEQPARITSIYQRLTSAGVVPRCVKVEAREATDEELSSVHTENHVELMKAVSSKSYSKHRRKALASRYDSIFFNNGSSKSALLAAGSVIEIADQVAQGKLKSGAAIVRPPGHHAEAGAAMGFCLFNNLAVAAHLLVHKKKELGVQKLLIVDWDIHHGNGTQHMFWSDPRVLYFSVHRFDNGSFYPAGDEGDYDHIGANEGAGYNINVPWPHGQFGDADYLAVWEHVLMPVAREYNPDMVLISAGFDSAEGDPLGGCRVTPSAYYKMTKQLMEIADGRVVIALEGGYNLTSTSNSYLACMHALLGDIFLENPTHLSNVLAPTLPLIHSVRNKLQQYWSVLSTDQEESDNVDDVAIESFLMIARKPEEEQPGQKPLTDLIELLAMLSTESQVGTDDGPELLSDAHHQPGTTPSVRQQPVNLDAAIMSSEQPDLPGCKMPTDFEGVVESSFREMGETTLSDKDSEEGRWRTEMEQIAQGNNEVKPSLSAIWAYDDPSEDVSTESRDEEARKGPIRNVKGTTKPELSQEAAGQSMDATVLSSATNGVDNDETGGHNVAQTNKVAQSSEIVRPSSVGISDGKAVAPSEGVVETSYVWYACYGSNMWLPRFMCYIRGSQVQGMAKDCIGCRDPSPPGASLWSTTSNRLFFGRKFSYTWGVGGVTAFIDPVPEDDVKTYVHVYKITLEQFKDIFLQENSIDRIANQQFTIIDADLIQSLRNSQPATSHTVFEDRWYGTIVYLGDKDGIPILSFTCSLEDTEKFRSGNLDVHVPAAAYERAIARSLIDDMGLSEAQARDYIANARLSHHACAA